MDTEKLAESISDLEFGIRYHGGVFNEDLNVLDGVDPQAWSIVEDSAEEVLDVTRAVLDADKRRGHWCHKHKAAGSPHHCWKAYTEHGGAEGFDCRMVPARLLTGGEE